MFASPAARRVRYTQVRAAPRCAVPWPAASPLCLRCFRRFAATSC